MNGKHYNTLALNVTLNVFRNLSGNIAGSALLTYALHYFKSHLGNVPNKYQYLEMKFQ